MILTLVGIVIGCSDIVTKSKSDPINTKTYELTIHEYIVMEYEKRLNTNHWDAVLQQNRYAFTTRDGNIDFDAYVAFIIENIDKFSDPGLYADVMREALVKFGVDIVEAENLIEIGGFNESTIERYYDVNNEFGGVNFMRQTESERLNEVYTLYVNEVQSSLSTAEQSNMETILSMVINGNSVDNIVDFIDSTANNSAFSDSYKNTLHFAINTILFYDSDDIESLYAPGDGVVDVIGQVIICNYVNGQGGICAGTGHILCGTGGSVTSSAYRAVYKWISNLFSKN